MAEPQTTPRPPIPVLSLNSIYARRDNLSSALTQFLGRQKQCKGCIEEGAY